MTASLEVANVAGSSKLLVLGDSQGEFGGVAQQLFRALQALQNVDVVTDCADERSLSHFQDPQLAGICLLGDEFKDRATQLLLLQPGGVLSQLNEGIALLDPEFNILWSNPRFHELTLGETRSLAGQFFYQAFGTPELLGPDYSPLHSALGQKAAAQSLLRLNEKTYLQLQVTPILHDPHEGPTGLIVMLRDVSREILEQHKLNAVYRAGLELGDLSPSELASMTVDERVEMLKVRIEHFTKDLLKFQTVEIRLLDPETKRLDPLLVVGMKPEAEARVLYALPQDNGVTGFVAATGKSYLCHDIGHDPLYLPGAPAARSSLTVPLILHDQILGTFNVESTQVGAFTESDLRFLELFSSEVAVAINTLELLAVQRVASTTESVDRILREISQPVDDILNEATWILDRNLGQDDALAERLKNILNRTRIIKQLIHQVGETLAPVEDTASSMPQRAHRPKLRKKRILVADNDDSIRRDAHTYLGQVGCVVETAHNGNEALLMMRRGEYDVVLVDIALPDMTGFECLCQIREMDSELPVIFIQGFGHDPKHNVVDANRKGYRIVALFKPFRKEHLLNEVENAITGQRKHVTHPPCS